MNCGKTFDAMREPLHTQNRFAFRIFIVFKVVFLGVEMMMMRYIRGGRIAFGFPSHGCIISYFRKVLSYSIVSADLF
jgi:hypothetical protein